MIERKGWRKGFHRALLDAVVRNGSPLDTKPDWFGWIHPGYVALVKKVHDVGVDYDATPDPQEANWSEFMGTFYEGDTRVYGLEVDLVLKDGSTVRYRYKGTLGELIHQVVTS
jgi:hypothetical protein